MISPTKPQLGMLGVLLFPQLRAPIVASIKRRSDRVSKLFVTLV